MQSSTDVCSGGAAWVDRFLLPLLKRHFPAGRSLACLQVAPDDRTEADQLGAWGHKCEMIEPDPTHRLAVRDNCYDLVFTGHFTSRAPEAASREVLAREFYRVLVRGGALLVLFGNRWSPLDLTRNGPVVHGPWSSGCLSHRGAMDVLVHAAGFAFPIPVGLDGHFGWARLPAWLRIVGKLFDCHWRYVATPARTWLYFSPLNPAFLLWLKKP